MDSLRYPVIGLFTELVKNHVKNYSGIPSDFCTTSITSSTYPVYQTRRFLHETGHSFLLTDCYVLTDATVGEYAVQQALRNSILYYRNIATAAREKGKPWMCLGQVSRYGADVHLREPNIREIAVQANIMAALGAKGVGYYCFFSHAISPVDSVSGLVDGNGRAIHMDSYGEDKAAAVRAVNIKLENIGPTLMQLTWKNDARNVSELSRLELNDSIRVANVVTRDDTTEVLDPENGRYFHIGWLQNEDETEDYLYITNMRTQKDSGRTIALSFAGSKAYSILIESVDRSKGWVIGSDTTFAEAFEPGEGRLYRVRDATLFDGTLLDTLTTVTSGAIFDVYENMILQGHQTLAIQPTGNLYCHDSVYIELNGASIQNRGTMLFGSAHALRGTGTIEGNGELAWSRSIRTEWNDSLTFRNGMTFSTQCLPDSTNAWENYGVICFEGTTPYRFERCIDSILNGGGRWELRGGVTLANIPHFVNWSGALLESNGTEQTSLMQFASGRNLDNYGHLFSRYTFFEGASRDTSAAWHGILSAYGEAVLVLDTCIIRDIRTVNDGGGSAIHLYESPSPQNIVRRTAIERSISLNPEGDGIFSPCRSRKTASRSSSTQDCT